MINCTSFCRHLDPHADDNVYVYALRTQGGSAGLQTRPKKKEKEMYASLALVSLLRYQTGKKWQGWKCW